MNCVCQRSGSSAKGLSNLRLQRSDGRWRTSFSSQLKLPKVRAETRKRTSSLVHSQKEPMQLLSLAAEASSLP